MAKHILAGEGLMKRFAVGEQLLGFNRRYLQALAGVSLAIKEGETLGLVGESGCGKTTLGKCLMRILTPEQGRILFDGEDITKQRGARLKRLRKCVQMVFQDPYASLNPRMSVYEILSEGLLTLKPLQKEAKIERITAILEAVGLSTTYVDQYPHMFSGGQRQRIGIARALLPHPKVLVCDEPVSALDVSVQAQIIELLKDIKHKFSLSILFISHDLTVVHYLCDRVAVMYLGRIVELASVQSLYSVPMHPYTQALLAAIPAREFSLAGPTPLAPPLDGETPNPLGLSPGCAFSDRCPKVKPRCRREAPELRVYGQAEQGRWVACHYA